MINIRQVISQYVFHFLLKQNENTRKESRHLTDSNGGTTSLLEDCLAKAV